MSISEKHSKYTTSLAFPNMFNVARNQVDVYSDNASIVNRTRLLMLTDPTELYHVPNFGVGLKKYLWTYNTENTRAIIENNIKEQLRLHEPYVLPDETQFSDMLLYTGDKESIEFKSGNEFNMTCGLKTTYQDTVDVILNDTDE